MKNYKNLFIMILAIIILSFIIYYLYLKRNDIYSHTSLYPPIKPINTYYIKVSDIHTVHYSTYGNVEGEPVLFVHGGPGAGVTDNSARFFNPNDYYIVLVDQRGCGKSTPSGELKENTTQDLIEDFEKIRKSLNIKKWQLFGGSWGSTLSLAYAIKYPDVITCMILRGIFLCTVEEIEWLFGSDKGGSAKFDTNSWNNYVNTLPYKQNNIYNRNYIEEYHKCFNGDYGKEKRDECLLSWTTMENSIVSLEFHSLDEVIKRVKEKENNYSEVALLENHYILNNCFLEPGYYFKSENIEKIKNIPTIIIQGKYDLICPPKAAYKLHDLLPNSKLYITLAGHSAYDDENIKFIIQSTNSFIK